MSFVEQPISDEQAEALYEAIFVGLGDGTKPLVVGCDHTFKYSHAWAEANDVEFAALKSWLNANGGFCDCEVLFNVMPDDEEETDE